MIRILQNFIDGRARYYAGEIVSRRRFSDAGITVFSSAKWLEEGESQAAEMRPGDRPPDVSAEVIPADVKTNARV